MTKTKVQELPGGALIVTIPKALADAVGIKKGSELDWKLEGERLYVQQ